MARNASPETADSPPKEADAYGWALRQAELLRAGRLSEIDPIAIAEEIDDVALNEFDKLESALRIVMFHLLKWDHQPERRSRSWTLSIAEHRRRAARQLRKNPGLKPKLDEALDGAYEDARLEASAEIDVPPQTFPVTRPFSYTEIMERSIVWPGDEP
ncbi:MAG: DUF29 domain-containing protein [Hyphomicrobiales bacterium]|nr:DUF29 domain-containing protein [Hyphomicrobiales bacterium]